MKRNLISKAVAGASAPFLPYAPYPPACERAAWSCVDKKLAAEFTGKAEELVSQGFERFFAPIPATLYLDFSRTGNRKRFEDAYFGRRIRLNLLVLAECIEHTGRFLDAVIDGVYALCEESGWALPAHNSYERNQPQLALPDSLRPVLDLFACETGAQLALIHYLLRKELDEVTPMICARIRSELKKRLFAPYLAHKFWWQGFDRQPTNNWTVWCTQNVLLAAFLPGVADDAGELTEAAGSGGRELEMLRRKIAKRAAFSIDRFLSEYGEDGCCDEGAQYYRHAGLCLYGALSVLGSVCGEAGKTVFAEKQIQNIAEYIVHIHAAGRYYFNFADCAACAGYAGVREYLFGAAVQSDSLKAFAASGWKARHAAFPIHDYASSDDTLNLFYLVQELFVSGTVLSATEQPVAEYLAVSHVSPVEQSLLEEQNRQQLPLDYAYRSVGIYISRCRHFALAVKAGANADSHNHNDTGSFILYKDGLPFVIDVGVETYSKKTFSSERYSIWTMQSAYHNVTNFDAAMQADGKDYKAKRVRYMPGDVRTVISLQLEKAYDTDSKVTGYRRSVVHEKNTCVVVSDTVRGDFETAYFTLMTQEKPNICVEATGAAGTSGEAGASGPAGSFVPVGSSGGKPASGTLTIAVGSIGTITLSGAETLNLAAVSIEAVPVTDSRLRQSWPETLYRVRVAYTGTLTARFS